MSNNTNPVNNRRKIRKAPHTSAEEKVAEADAAASTLTTGNPTPTQGTIVLTQGTTAPARRTAVTAPSVALTPNTAIISASQPAHPATARTNTSTQDNEREHPNDNAAHTAKTAGTAKAVGTAKTAGTDYHQTTRGKGTIAPTHLPTDSRAENAETALTSSTKTGEHTYHAFDTLPHA